MSRATQVMLTSLARSALSALRESFTPVMRHARTLARYPQVEFRYPANARDCLFDSDIRIFAHTALNNVTVGRCTYIGGGALISNCEIGRFCSIAPDVRIGIGIHPTKEVVSTYPGFYSSKASGVRRYFIDECIEESRRIVIGSDVWIGLRAVICDGITIGDGAIVAAGSVVTKDVPPYAIVGGVPAKVIRSRVSELQKDRLLKLSWWNWNDEEISEAAELMLDVDRFLKSRPAA